MGISRRVRVGLLGLLGSAAALYFLSTQINLSLFSTALSTARYGYAFLCVILLIFALLPRALRWRALLEGGLPALRAFNIMNVAYLVNGVLPLRLGELARIFLATRADPPLPMARTAGTVIIERLLDLLAVVLLLALALTAGPVPEQLRLVGGMTALAALGGFLLLVIAAARRAFITGLLASMEQKWALVGRLRAGHIVGQFLDGLAPLTRPQALAVVLLWTALAWTLSVLAGYTLMFAFYEQGSMPATLLFIAAAAFAIAVPAVPLNVGTYEASILLALGAMGFAQDSTAVAFAVMVHAVNLIVHASTGVLGLIQEGISLVELSHNVRQMQMTGKVTVHDDGAAQA